MGRPSSSSKKKSSKNKIPKISSEARRKKRSRKIKSKKHSRLDESISSYSDDDLSSSLSVSSSNSEDDYRSRKSRSRTRDVKGSRKRARRSSSSRGGSVDSPRRKKKRSGVSESKKKLSKRKKKKTKKPKRDSISPVSSDTHSCSTCQGESDSDSDRERLKERSIKKKKSKKRLGKGRSISRKSRDRSRSVSSHSKLSDSVDNNNNGIELFTNENNSRRLRSVITVVTREEENEGNKDEFEEEIVYDHDDYPSSRSNDSNEAGNKRELAHRTMENVIGEYPSVSNLKSLDPTLTSTNGSDRYEELKYSSDGTGSVSPKEKESDVMDLELILRQRALENLKRFKGGHQKNVVPKNEKNKSNNEMKPPSNVETELVPNKRAVENTERSRGGSQVNVVVPVDARNETHSTGEPEFVQNNQLKQEVPDVMGASELAVKRSRFTWKRDSSLPTGTEEKILPNKIGGTNSAASKLKDATLRQLGLPSGSGEKARNVKPLASRLQTLPSVKLSLTDNTINKSPHETVGDVSQTLAEKSSCNTGDIGISDAHGSNALEAPSSVLAEEGSSREQQQNDAKDGSQFEQKTMTVMRGGELVQVNYKVYIPKKVPALARRQLKR